MFIFVGFFVTFAATLRSACLQRARIALSERARELASLRVLGFTRCEVSYILLGEIGAPDAGWPCRSAACSAIALAWYHDAAPSRPSCTGCRW